MKYAAVCVAALLWATLLLLAEVAPAQAPDPDALVGVWATEDGTGRIEFTRQQDRFFGRIVAQSEKDRQKYKTWTDWTLYKNFVFNGDKYEKGSVTDPGSGKQYDATIELIDDGKRARFKAFWGLLSFKETWTRVK